MAQAAAEIGLVVENPMALVLTDRRLLTLKIGAPIGLGMGGADDISKGFAERARG